jgi:hypothetical protein
MVTGGRDRVWRRLMRDRALAIWGNRPVLAAVKLEPQQTLAGDARLLLVMLRRFYWLPAFWTGSFPVLVLPHTALKHGLLENVGRFRRGR